MTQGGVGETGKNRKLVVEVVVGGVSRCPPVAVLLLLRPLWQVERVQMSFVH